MDVSSRTSRAGTKKMVKKRTVIVGLKPDSCGREMLLRLLSLAVVRGDCVLAVHVQESDVASAFDPNTFHIHEDICKSKQVDFEVKICFGSCYITELCHQVRLKFATILAIGGGTECPKDSTIGRFLKALPHSCTLLVMDNGGKVLFQKMGTSQQGSSYRLLRSFMSSPTPSSYCNDQPETRPIIRKFLSMPCSSSSAPLDERNHQKISQRVAMLELKGHIRRFTFQELDYATDGFAVNALIEDRENSKLYQAVLEKGCSGAVIKVLTASQYVSVEYICRELDVLSGLKHENIAQVLGYCWCNELSAIIYCLPDSTLKQRLNQMIWSERMKVAVGLAKALDFLHSSYPAIVHGDVKPSNILLSIDCKPKLSDFGAALHPEEATSSCEMGQLFTETTSGYDEKMDVYSYGVVILELITGNAATPTSACECWDSSIRSLLSCDLCENLIDPNLLEDYEEDEMKMLMVVSRLCLLHSSSRRPTMKTILRLLEEPENWWEMRENGRRQCQQNR